MKAKIVIITFIALITALYADISSLPLDKGQKALTKDDQGYNDKLQIQYLGVGGYLIRRGSDVILMAPFYSNPGLFQVGFRKIRCQEKLVEQLLPDVSDVTAILVGHAHYDHLMDVPYIAKNRATSSTIYGSQTVKHILAATLDKKRTVAVNAMAANGDKPGQWIAVGKYNIRFMPIISEHAPHLGGVKLYPGKLTKDLAKLPVRANGWVEGQTLAYVIDFLGQNGEIDYRIYYSDAASNAPIGFLPEFFDGDKKIVDVAILCAASFHLVKNYPKGIVANTQARCFIAGHWEDFFRSPTKPLLTVPGTSIHQFIKNLEAVVPKKSKIILPKPHGVFVFSK